MRLIDADALIEDIDGDLTDSIAEGRAIEKIMNAPTIEPKKGKWIYKRDLKQFFCDQCGCPSLTDDDRYIYGMDLPNFCEDCGADMRGDNHETDRS